MKIYLTKTEQKYNFKSLVILGFIGIILLRIIPHVANFIPIFALLTVFAANTRNSKLALILLALIAIIISDLLLSVIHSYPIFGAYSFFTYSGFVLTILLNFKSNKLPGILWINTIIATVMYWLWTNFGVWIADSMYILDLSGFILCYTVALPFLKYSLLANTLGILAFSIYKLRNHECSLISRVCYYR